jgi:spore germination cell wall hydrolase CwlJ-like protein
MKYLIRGAAGIVAVGLLTANVLTLIKVNKLTEDVAQIQQDIQEVQQDIQEVQQGMMYKTEERIQVSEKEMGCLARNIFYEAGIEDKAGKVAVAQVTLNRLRTGRWGTDLCSVVYARAQFSWTLDKKKKWAQPKGPLWQDSLQVAGEFVHNGKRIKGLEHSTYYHADYVQPYWRKHVVKIQQIGQHIFYKPFDT